MCLHFDLFVCSIVCFPAWRQWWRESQTPMMHFFSLFCCVRAVCGFVCVSRSSRLVALEARSCFRPLLLPHSLVLIPTGHCCPFLHLPFVVFRLFSLHAIKLFVTLPFFLCPVPRPHFIFPYHLFVNIFFLGLIYTVFNQFFAFPSNSVTFILALALLPFFFDIRYRLCT